MGGIALAIAAAFIGLTVQVVALIDVLRRPTAQFVKAERSRRVWIAVCLLVPVLGGALYLARIRPAIFAANSIEPTPILPPRAPVPTPPSHRGVRGRLYHGETRVDFVGRSKLWFGLSGLIILIGLVGLDVRGLNLGIDFEGGVVWELPAGDLSVEDARDFMDEIGVPESKVQTLEAGGDVRLRIQAAERPQAEVTDIAAQLAERVGVTPSDVDSDSVSASWGEEITDKAVRALLVFLVAITIYVSIRFEFKMAVATMAAMLHDVLVTIGVYAVAGFEVTPATVIAILTILGFSIYDGIVVFDKVDENTRMVSSTTHITYSDMVNISLNQTLMRSLNTQITALLPMASLLIVGSLVLGATTLQEFAVALLVGQFSGAYSSIFIASPLLAIMKEREPRFRDVRRRIQSRTAAGRGAQPEPELVGAGATAGGTPVAGTTTTATTGTVGTVARPTGAIPPRPRKKGKRR
jgi:preprotein translocase subunit SecF